MRWFAASVVAVIVLWCAYLASPYWALYRLAAAVRAGNVAEVGDLVNVRALRVALVRQLTDDLTALDRTGTLGAPETRVAAASAFVLGDPILESLVTPAGVVRLLTSDQPLPDITEPSPFSAGRGHGIVDLLTASSWRGFRNVYFGLPPEEPPGSRFKLQMRLSRLSWRLISIELPPTTQRKLAEQLLRRVSIPPR